VAPGAPDDPSQDYRQLAGSMAHLARRGFVVVAPDLSWLAPDDGPARRAAALRDALSHLRAGSRGPLLAELDRVGLVGHGLGGLAAATLAADRTCPFHVRALGLLAPVAGAGAGWAAGLGGLPPVLVLRGAADTGTAGAGEGPAALYDVAPAPRLLVTIPGANHFGFTTSLALAAPFDGAPAMSRRDQQRVARAYLTAFFEHHLRGVEEAGTWLRGELPIADIEALGARVLADPDCLAGP
jgi:pimeloyl-ACP methyl ester carboxylesterase